MTEAHAVYALECLQARLEQRRALPLSLIHAALAELGPAGERADSAALDDEADAAIFVTYNTLLPCSTTGESESDGDAFERRLRGCIGTFAATASLRAQIEQYSLVAALDDTRFSPIKLSELRGSRSGGGRDDGRSIECCVSVLCDFTPLASPALSEWTIGEHGLQLSYSVAAGTTGGRRRASATYLPEVAAEQGWSKEQTLDSLFRKGGWRGARGADFRSECAPITAKTYRSVKARASYDRYLEVVQRARETQGAR